MARSNPAPDTLAEAAPWVRRECVCLHLQRAARAVGRHYDAALAPLELTHEQFSLLMMLARESAPTVGELAAELALDRTTLSSNLRPLVRRELLALDVDADDARARRVSLTMAGRSRLHQALPRWQAAQRAVLDAHPALDWAHLRLSLNGLAA